MISVLIWGFRSAWLLINYFDGVEINSRSNVDKAVYSRMKDYPKTCQVYADEPWNVLLYFDTKVLWLPRQILFGTGFVNQNYDADVQALRTRAQLILVERPDDPIISLLDQSEGFKRIYQRPDGIIWVNQTIDQHLCTEQSNVHTQK